MADVRDFNEQQAGRPIKARITYEPRPDSLPKLKSILAPPFSAFIEELELAFGSWKRDMNETGFDRGDRQSQVNWAAVRLELREVERQREQKGAGHRMEAQDETSRILAPHATPKCSSSYSPYSQPVISPRQPRRACNNGKSV